MPSNKLFGLVGALMAALLLSQPCLAALDKAEVLVTYVPGTPGEAIAAYYKQAHGLADSQLLALTGAPTGEEISAADYLTYYRNPINDYLGTPAGDNVKVIVTTKGMPLRIEVTQPMPTTYPGWRGDLVPPGYSMPVIQQLLGGPGGDNDPWKVYSSLESELTRIRTIDNVNQMGDQAYYLSPGNPVFGWAFMGQPYHQAANPLFHQGFPAGADADDPFDPSAREGIILTSRLDGYTLSDVYGAIDRAQQAQLAAIVVDDDPNAAATLEDRMQQLKDNVLAPANQAYVYDNTDAAITVASSPVAGYVSHGVNDGAGGLAPGYIAGQLNGLDLADGAVFFTYESYNAFSFETGGGVDGHALIADWLAAGGTVGIGSVEEPLAAADFSVNVDVLFDALLAGYSWAEAAWRAMPQLSYVNTVIGDPLMTLTRAPGDMNGDGIVNAEDIDALYANLTGSGGSASDVRYDLDGDGDADRDDVEQLITSVLQTTYADFNLDSVVNATDLMILALGIGLDDEPGWAMGDANGDGIINGVDLAILRVNFGFIGASSDVPEPATMAILAVGAVALLKRRRA